jgi:hypothetical protein
MRVWLLAVLLVSCSPTPMGPADPMDEPLPDLPRVELPRDDEDRPTIVIENGVLRDLPERLNLLVPGPTTLLVRNRVDGARVDVDGLDLSTQAIALWLRGRGRLRHLRPEHTIGLVNSGAQEDWHVDLPPGEYVLTVTSGGTPDALQEAILLVAAP